MAELGYPGLVGYNRYSLLAPAGTPRATIETLNRAALRAMEGGALRDRQVPLNVIFGVFAGTALLSIFIVLSIRLRPMEGQP